MNRNIYTNKSIYSLLTVLFFIISLLFFSWKSIIFEFEYSIDSERFGQFGDFFGGVLGTIFALISVLFLVNTFLQQRKITYENKSLVKTQRFNDLFFELLKIHQEQTKELEVIEEVTSERKSYTYNNKDFFDYNKKIIQNSFITQGSYSRNIREAQNAYSLFYLQYKSKLAIYYRTLYRIFDLIDNANLLEEDSKKHYSKIIRAQLTESELFFLRYNALTYYGDKFIRYINKYNVLKHLPHFELLEFKHWWSLLSNEERASIDVLFYLIKDLIKEMINDKSTGKKQVPIISFRYTITINLIGKSDLSLEIKINTLKQNTTNIYMGFDKFSNETLQALIDCFIKELVMFSNFKKYNTFKELKFHSLPILSKGNTAIIQSGVKNKYDKELIFRYKEI